MTESSIRPEERPTTTAGRLVGVGLGPGDPALLTLAAVERLRAADRVFVPATGGGERSRVEGIVAEHVAAERIERLRFAMRDTDATASRYAAASERIAAELRPGATVAFGTLGDPNLYSTFSALARAVRALVPEVAVETIPGITAMQALAAQAGVVLAEGNTPVAIVPVLADTDAFRAALRAGGTVVAYKATGRLGAVLDALDQEGRLERAVYGERLGLAGERITAAADLDRSAPAPYLAALISPAVADPEPA